MGNSLRIILSLNLVVGAGAYASCRDRSELGPAKLAAAHFAHASGDNGYFIDAGNCGDVCGVRLSTPEPDDLLPLRDWVDKNYGYRRFENVPVCASLTPASEIQKETLLERVVDKKISKKKKIVKRHHEENSDDQTYTITTYPSAPSYNQTLICVPAGGGPPQMCLLSQ